MTIYLKLGKRDIEAVQPSAKRIYCYFDGKPGLVLQVMPSGKKSFQIYKRIKNGSPYREKLGDYPDLHPDRAWGEAQKKLALLIDGDPRPARIEAKQIEISFGELFDRYLNDYAKLHTKTAEELEKNYARYFRDRWHYAKVSTIRQTDIQNWLHKLAETVETNQLRARATGRHTANRQFDNFRAILNWGRQSELVKVDGDPCLGVKRFKTKARERFLLPGDEYVRFAKALENDPNPIFKYWVKLLLLTGMRSGDVMAMRWEHVNLDLAIWKIPDTKNDDSQTVSLIPSAVALLKEIFDSRTSDEWVLPGVGKTGHLVEPKGSWKKLITRAGITDLRPHDLRRTVGSFMAIAGVDTKIIGKALGHRSPQATAIYARLTQDPVRTALEDVEAALKDPAKLLSKRNKVVALNG